MKNDSFILLIVLLSILFFLGATCGTKPPPPPPPPPEIPTSVTDIDNNTYQVKRFNNTLWMTENLRVTRYDTESTCYDEVIQEVANNQRVDMNNPYYNNAKDFIDPPYTDNLTREIRNRLGVLYNWSAATGAVDNNASVNDYIQGICPNGWRLPNTKDWDSLCTLLGGKKIAGEKLKAQYGWYSVSGSNESGMECYPAGLAAGNYISFVGRQIMFWCPKGLMLDKSKAEVTRIYFDKDEVELGLLISKIQANSVRCVKDIIDY